MTPMLILTLIGCYNIMWNFLILSLLTYYNCRRALSRAFLKLSDLEPENNLVLLGWLKAGY